jgi:hypothetical protein
MEKELRYLCEACAEVGVKSPSLGCQDEDGCPANHLCSDHYWNDLARNAYEKHRGLPPSESLHLKEVPVFRTRYFFKR